MIKPLRGTRLNRTHPLARGLIGCWLFNEGTGDKVFDSSGNDSEGTMDNFSASEAWTSAYSGGFSPRFDGADNAIRLLNPSVLNPTAQITLIAGVIPDSDPDPSNSWGRVISRGDGATGDLWALSFESSRQFDFRINNAFSLSVVQVDANVFSVIGGTYDGSNRRWYLNGNLIKTFPTTGAIGTGNYVRIGQHGDGVGRHYQGYIAFVFIYDIALSNEAMMSFANDPYQMFDIGINPAIFGDLNGAPPPSIIPSQGRYPRPAALAATIM